MWGGTPWPWAPIAASQNRSRPTPWSPWSTRCCGRRKAARRSREVRDGTQTRLAARGRPTRRRRRDEHLVLLAVVGGPGGQAFRTFPGLGGLGVFPLLP